MFSTFWDIIHVILRIPNNVIDVMIDQMYKDKL